jgi:sialate O-acetylesterase
MKSTVLAVLVSFYFCAGVHAQLRLPAIIADDMVLQQQANVRLWGWSSPGDKVYVTTSWNNKTDSVLCFSDAKWMILVSTPAAGGPYSISIRSGKTIVLNNILIGEVWLCSGQSNMEMNSTWGLPEVNAVFKDCANKNIRFFQVPKTGAKYPQDDVKGSWAVCDSNSLRTFSAVGYFFGQKLNSQLQVPIGLIGDAWGGTSSEVWTPEEAIADNVELKQEAGRLTPAANWPHLVGSCYNGMIAPLVSFNIAGVIWYQGEANTDNAGTYRKIFTSMIDSWRWAWNKDLPFYYVQIAPYNYGSGYAAASVREQQSLSLSHHNVGMVVTTDLVDNLADIHPKLKKEVGLRLANYALAETYNQSVGAYKSPQYKRMDIVQNKINIYFDQPAEGMLIKGGTARELFIAGPDKKFVPATMEVKKDFITVSSELVKSPVAVRFGFSNNGIGNLFSKDGLPVIPFRTDDWVLEKVNP